MKEYDSLVDMLEDSNANGGNMWHSMIRYFERKARAKFSPFRGAFELTPLCNLDCKMCYVHLNREQLSATNRSVLSGDQWVSIIDQAVEAGLMYALITGGEALLHPDFDRIYLHMLSRGVLITLNTNGLLLSEERIAFLVKHPPKKIQVTLYGDNDDVYEMVTGHRVFSRVLEGIQRLRDADLLFDVGIVPNRYMTDHGEAMIQLLESMGIAFSVNTNLFCPREETGRAGEQHDLSLDEYIELYKSDAKRRGKEYIPLCQKDVVLPGGSSDEKPFGFRCGGGRSSFAVSWDGVLHPCLMMTEIGYSLHETPFLTAWRQVNHAVAGFPFPQECIGCAYEAVCPVCIKQHMQGAPIGHANQAICERAQRLAKEGMIQV